MTSFNEKTKIFSGPKLPNGFDTDVPLGRVLLSRLSEFPEKVIQISENGVKITCGELSTMSKKVAAFLIQANMKFGDVIGFCGKNTSNLSSAVIGCILLGLPISPVGVTLEVDELIDIFKRTNPKFIFCDHDQVEKFQKALKLLELDLNIVTLTEKVDGFCFIKDLFANDELAFNVQETFSVSPDKVCVVILQSSGSTGAPKLVQVSQAQMLNHIDAFKNWNSQDDDTLELNFNSLFWISGFGCIIHSVLDLRTTLITRQPFSAEHCVELIKRFKPSQMAITPTAVPLLCEYLEQNSVVLESMRLVSTAGGFISVKTINAMERLMTNGRVIPFYALTENAAIVSRGDINAPASSSVGVLCRNTQVKILLSDEVLGSVGDVGEILIKRQFNIIGYLNNDKQTNELIDDEGWIHTGDMGYFDENLNLFIIGRVKFMIRCMHHQVNPTEIEQVIAELPGVLKVCVVAVPDRATYKAPCAVIERSADAPVNEYDVHRAVSHLEVFKQLKGGVFFMEKFPLTATGKIKRNEIEKMALELSKLC